MRVQDVMTTDVVTVQPQATLREAARLLVDHRISGLVVTDAAGAVVGMLSQADILARERGREERGHGLLGRLFELGTIDPRLDARLVSEAMSSPVLTTTPRAQLSEVAGRLLDAAVNRLPVLDGGRLVGIVTRSDLVRAFTRSDEEIRREIREDVVFRSLWIAPESVDVSVENGEVTLSGTVETSGDAEVLPIFVERVPGVVAVRSKLTYRTRDAVKGR